MALSLTDKARLASRKSNVQPNLVFSIAGYDRLFGALAIARIVKIGEPGLKIGGGWKIGGLLELAKGDPLVSFGSGGTTTRLQTQVAPDRAQASSVTSITVSVVDKSELASALISPGFVLEDVLGQDATVLIGFVGTSYPQDFNTVFRGVIVGIDSGPGFVNFLLSSTDEKARRASFAERSWPLSADVNPSQTTLPTSNPNLFAVPAQGPDGSYDSSIEYLVRIDDEILSYTGRDSANLTGVTRARFGTVAVAHSSAQGSAEAKSMYRLRGNGMDLALKILLSGWNGDFVSGVEATSFVSAAGGAYIVANSIYLAGVDVEAIYGLTVGDYITVTGATNGANNCTAKRIAEINQDERGSFIVIDGVSFVYEIDSPAVCAFRSQYDTLGEGLKLKPTEVDIAEFQRIQSVFTGSFFFDFLVDNIDNSKDWIERELLLPQACFSVNRKGRFSVSIHVGPISGDVIRELNVYNVLNADRLKLQRSLSSNFTNTIRYSYDYDPIDGDFKAIRTYQSADSLRRVPTGEKVLEVQSKGLTTANDAEGLGSISSLKFLGRYQYGAEFIKGMSVMFGDGYPIEIGDIVLVDFKSLKLTDTKTGSRAGTKKLFEVLNKSLDVKTGAVSIDVVSTAFGTDERYAVISPASQIGAGATVSRLPLKRSFATKPFQTESRKWVNYVGQTVRVRSEDFTSDQVATILDVDVSTDPAALIVSGLSTAPLEDYVIEPPPYDDGTDSGVNAVWKNQFAFLNPTVQLASGVSQTEFVVALGKVGLFKEGATVRIHNADFTDYSSETTVTAVDLTTGHVTIRNPSGFTLTVNHFVELIGFADGGGAYRWI